MLMRPYVRTFILMQGVFSSEKIPVWLLTIDLSADSVTRARGVHYQSLVLCFMGEEQRAMFSKWDKLLRLQARFDSKAIVIRCLCLSATRNRLNEIWWCSAVGVNIEDEIVFRDEVTAKRQAAEVMAMKPKPTL